MSERGHEFIEVGARRWCMGCDLFQRRTWIMGPFPDPRQDCPCNTPYAAERDGHLELPLTKED
jgi:hypothetical protein